MLIYLSLFLLAAGQIELYTHIPVIKRFIEHLQSLDYRVAAVYFLDAQFLGAQKKD